MRVPEDGTTDSVPSCWDRAKPSLQYHGQHSTIHLEDRATTSCTPYIPSTEVSGKTPSAHAMVALKASFFFFFFPQLVTSFSIFKAQNRLLFFSLSIYVVINCHWPVSLFFTQ